MGAFDIVDPLTQEVAGQLLRYGGERGPCLYADTPMRLGADASFRDRGLAVIASIESPMQRPDDATNKLSPQSPGLNSVQAYEPHVSLGLCHAISRYGAAQSLVRRVLAQHPELSVWFGPDGGYGIEAERDRFFDDGLGTSAPRSTNLCLALRRILGGWGPDGQDPTVVASVQEIQTSFFADMIRERGRLVRAGGWDEAARRDERLMLILADLAINTGVALMRDVLASAYDKTAVALTAAREAAHPPTAARARFMLTVDRLVCGGVDTAPIVRDGVAPDFTFDPS